MQTALSVVKPPHKNDLAFCAEGVVGTCRNAGRSSPAGTARKPSLYLCSFITARSFGTVRERRATEGYGILQNLCLCLMSVVRGQLTVRAGGEAGNIYRLAETDLIDGTAPYRWKQELHDEPPTFPPP